MNLPALQRLALSSGKACAAILKRSGGSEARIRSILRDAAALTALISAAHRLTRSEILRLTETPSDITTITAGTIEHVRFMARYK